ncbi:T9SS type A sorting domain-containing protein [Haliscomenobacter sp.]|uniref:T9SS type A sorting domain-containing protein n=1 Tax=Haliscomenobacter sp. TaxID=2717303 RepID=UPI00336523FF
MNNYISLVIFLLFGICSSSGFAQQPSNGKRIYVATASTAGSKANGQSWETAFPDFQQALKIAKYGDSVWIAQGTYSPTFSIDETVSFVVPIGVKIFGGFKGSERYIDTRNWTIYPTILSGKIGTLETIKANSLHVLSLIDPDSLNLIDGVIIENGNATKNTSNSSDFQSKGGGILVLNNKAKKGKITIRNAIFRNNIGSLGGGIALLETQLNVSTESIIESCMFQQNYGQSFGGAIYVQTYSHSSNITINECQFVLNSAVNLGATIFHSFAGNVKITNSTFDRNESRGTASIRVESINDPIQIEGCEFKSESLVVGGVIDILALGDPTSELMAPHTINIYKNKFSNILSPSDGGAISVEVNGLDAYIKLTIEDCKIDETVSSLGANGIKIVKNTRLSTVECNINRCVFYKNSISRKLFGIINFINYSGEGNPIKGTINNSLFYKNTGPVIYTSQYSGGKIDLKILNSTFFGNKQGEIVRNAREAASQISVYIQNTIFQSNQTSLSAILQNTTAANLQNFSFNHCVFSTPTCTSTGDTTGCGIGNIFGQYPKFVDSTSVAGLKLAPGSVAINAGRWHPDLTQRDLLGQPRVQDCKVDLGAYESPSVLSSDDTLYIKTQIRSTPINMKLGEIGIQQISGGFPPYRLRWENGDSLRVRSALSAGQYTLTITDKMGCFKIYTYTVPFTTSINELDKVRERVYCVPNPQNKGQKISIHYENVQPGQWEAQISDFSGKVLARQNHLLQAKGVFNFPQGFELPVGMYFITLRKDAHVLSTKLMISQ